MFYYAFAFFLSGLTALSIVATAEERTRFTPSSTRKLMPTKPTIMYVPTLSKPAPAPHSFTVSRKNTTHPSRNTPVFTTGHTIAAAITAARRFFDSMSLYTSPAQRPASVPFNRQVITVPGIFIAKKADASASVMQPNT